MAKWASRLPALMHELRQLQRLLDSEQVHLLRPQWVGTADNEADAYTCLLDRDNW